ncbi:MAG TPA: lipoyl(octanoyl) transferase LipB [Anaerolineae bacterium]|nr:lipoyl(octanoyl) transferase LipB [Anaerolineae bacterium]
MAAHPVCEVHRLGLVTYEDAWRLQRKLAERRATGEVPDTLLLLEHPPVYTTGKRTAGSNLKLPAEMLGAPLVVSDRGGDITFHGPGQLIAYPIIDLRCAGLGVVSYVRKLEDVVMRTLRDCGIESGLECGLTGVWVGREKIAAIGVRVSRPGGAGAGWVTTHGVALNVDVDLAWFEHIVPCGITDRGVTSMARSGGTAPSTADVADRLTVHFGEVFGREMQPVSEPLIPLSLPSAAF